MQKRVAKNLIVITLICAFLVSMLTLVLLIVAQREENRAQLSRSASFIMEILPGLGENYQERLNNLSTISGYAITLLGPGDAILFDNASVFFAKDSDHAAFEAISEARQSGSSAYSCTTPFFSQVTLHHVRLFSDGGALCLTLAQANPWSSSIHFLPSIGAALAGIIVFCIFISRAMTRRILEPINALNLDDPLSNRAYPELSPLLNSLELQRTQLEVQMQRLERQRMTFSSVLRKMREGLLVLDSEQHVLVINNSACALFGVTQEDSVGKHMLQINDSPVIQSMMARAAAGNYGDAMLGIDEREYMLMCSPVSEQGDLEGIAVLILDVTASRSTVRMQREFSANVSHELKTPLTSIAGYASIIMNRIARPGDIQGFAERIYRESTRLTNMIQNIMLLSRMEESEQTPPFEDVDLLQLSHHVAGQYSDLAESKGVTVRVNGQEVHIYGVIAVLEVLVGNLIGNAIRYNKPGGSVDVTISSNGQIATLLVKDTGIGIPESHQTRIFERFFRVSGDSSVEGTGLGLAIVRRGALLHNAQIELQSAAGEGASIQVHFPLRAAFGAQAHAASAAHHDA